VDWATWHEEYDASPALMARLAAVRGRISHCLDLCPPGSIRIISVCAGEGRDLIGALESHPRATDVVARLVEVDPRLVERGRASGEAAGLSERLEFVVGDATLPASYRDFGPAHLVLACGVFGNIRAHDTARLVGSLAWLCARGGFVVWTRGLARGGAAHAARIRTLFKERAFEEVHAGTTPGNVFTIVTNRHLVDVDAPPDPTRLFEFVTRPGALDSGLL
jgi:hypothetical protein